MNCFCAGSELNALASGALRQLECVKTLADEWPEALLARGGETPVINYSPLPKYALSNLDYGMTIGITVTRGGRLFNCWVGGGDSDKAFFLVNKSDDGGESWSEPILVIDPHDHSLPVNRCCIVGDLWTDPMGRVWLFFNQTLAHFDGSSSNWYIRLDEPDAEELTWTEPRYIWRGETLNKLTVLKDGAWLLPVSLWARHHISGAFKACYHELDDMRMAHVFASTDGERFERRGGAAFPDTRFDEHMTVELTDGRLWMLARVKDGLNQSFSNDKGITWSKPERARAKRFGALPHKQAKVGQIAADKARKRPVYCRAPARSAHCLPVG